MSLYGALSAGVSGLNAQANNLALISDNIANVNTVGFKGSFGEFSTLVTQQSLPNSYAAGGVQFNRISQFDRQGILQSTSSATDVAVAGQGFFVVNTTTTATTSDQFLFSRAGSFRTDNQGNLLNTAGYYLQGWPTDPAGVPTTTNTSVLSNLETVNISGVSGTATATGNIHLGVNLPASDANGDSHTTNVEIFDSLGVAHDVGFTFTKSSVNEWGYSTTVPAGAAMIAALNSSGKPYFAQGQLEFTGQPADGDTVTIGSTTYEFDSNSSVTGGNTAVSIGTTLPLTIGNLATAVSDSRVTAGSSALTITQSPGRAALTIDPTSTSAITQSATGAFTIPTLTAYGSGTVTFSGQPADGDTITIGGTTYEFDNNAAVGGGNTAITIGGSLAATLANLDTAVTDSRMTVSGGNLNFLQTATGGSLAVSFSSAAITTSAFTMAAASPAVAFAGDGTPSAFNISSLSIAGWATGASDSSITLDLGATGSTDGLTQFSSDYTVNKISQDGVQFGSFSGVSISETGIVSANFDNGLSRAIYKIPLVSFTNPNGLISKNGNAFLASDNSGVPVLGAAKTGGLGAIAAGSLETSTVDLGSEFTNMIVAQRAYSANTKIITTVDDMLNELVQIKR
ncbi:MAG: flagellar hook protein FlgE [Gemmatimonas sp.]